MGCRSNYIVEVISFLVRSKLDYGCIVYGSASKTALAKLDPLEIQRDKLALQYVLKLKANPENPAYDVVFNPKHKELYKDKESATDSFGIHCK